MVLTLCKQMLAVVYTRSLLALKYLILFAGDLALTVEVQGRWGIGKTLPRRLLPHRLVVATAVVAGAATSETLRLVSLSAPTALTAP